MCGQPQGLQNRIALEKSADPDAAVAAALEKLGDISPLVQRFGHIVIKPNLGGGVPGEPGSHTSCAVLEAVLKIFSGFSRELFIAEADGSFNSADRMFNALAIHDLARRYGARAVNVSCGPSLTRAIERPKAMKSLRISSVFKDALIVSVPVLKTHPWCGVTVSMKNMYGAVYEREKAMLHSMLDENIVDINTVIGAHLSIVDATTAVVRGGFKCALWVGSPPTKMDIVMAGFNPVAVDAVGARLLKRDPWSIRYIDLAARLKLGCADIGRLDIVSGSECLAEA